MRSTRDACGWSCHQKKKEGRGKGGSVRGTRCESREPTGYWEKEKCIVHKDGEHCTMPWPRENGELRTRYRQRS